MEQALEPRPLTPEEEAYYRQIIDDWNHLCEKKREAGEPMMFSLSLQLDV